VKTCTQCGRGFDGEGEWCPQCALTGSVAPEPAAPVGAEAPADAPRSEEPADGEPPMSMSRRQFLTAGIVSVGGIMGVGYLGLALRYLLPSVSATSVAPQSVGPVSSFPQMSPVLKVIQEDGVEDGVFIVNTGHTILALDFHCTHLNCPINWYPGVDGVGRYICPCHGSQFTITGEHVAGPAPRGLYHHQVTIKNGQVLVGGIET
jgi:Rieske Fe-S protein